MEKWEKSWISFLYLMGLSFGLLGLISLIFEKIHFLEVMIFILLMMVMVLAAQIFEKLNKIEARLKDGDSQT